MSDMVGSAFVSIEAQGAEELGAQLEANILGAVQKIESELVTVGDQFSTLVSQAESLSTVIGVNLEVEGVAEFNGEIDSTIREQSEKVAEITVTADTAEANNQINELEQRILGLDEATGGAASGLGDLSSATDAAAAGAGLTQKSVDGLGAAISNISPITAAAVTGVALLSGTVASFFASAVGTEGATLRFNASLGDLAAEVNQIDVGSLNVSLDDLATGLGSSSSEVRNSISSFFEVGKASGAAGEDIAKASEELVALAARAISLNPELGSLDSVTERLSKTLQRGGPRLNQYGIEITAAEIKTRALEDRTEGTTGALTSFEKTAAASAISIERYGGSLKSAIAQGAENPIIALKAISQEFRNVTSELGRPLVTPIFDLIQAGQPILINVTKIFAELGQVAVPIATSLVSALSPIVDFFTGVLINSIGEVGPIFQGLADSIGSFLLDMGPGFDVLATTIGAVIDGFAALAAVAGEILDFLGALAPLIGAVAAVMLLLNLNPVFAIIAGVGLLAKAVGFFDVVSAEATLTATAFNESQLESARTLETVEGAMSATTDEFAKFIATQSAFSDAKLAAALSRVGLSTEDLREDLSGLSQGMSDFTAEAIEAGEVQIHKKGMPGLIITAEQVRKLGGAFSEQLATGEIVIGQGEDLVQAFNAQQIAQERLAETTLNNLVIENQLTDAQIEQAKAFLSTKGEVVSYSNVLDLVGDQQGPFAAAMAQSNEEIQGQIALWAFLGQALLVGQEATIDYQSVADDLGVSLADVQAFTRSVTEAMSAFVDAAVAKFPTVSQVLQDVEDASDPQSILNNIQAMIDAVNQFTVVVAIAGTEGLGGIQALLLELGPTASAPLIASLQEGGIAYATELERVLDLHKETLANAETVIEAATPGLIDAQALLYGGLGEASQDALLDPITGLPAVAEEAVTEVGEVFSGAGIPFREKTSAAATAATEGWMEGFRLKEPTGERLTEAQDEIPLFLPGMKRGAAELGAETSAAFTPEFSEATKNSLAGAEAVLRAEVNLAKISDDIGRIAGASFALGVAQGIADNVVLVSRAATYLVLAVKAAADLAARASSPSLLFAELGENIGDGLAMGIDDSSSSVVLAAENIIADAERAMGGSSLPGVGTALSGSVVSGGGGVTVGAVEINVSVAGDVTDERAREIGSLAGSSFIDEMRLRSAVAIGGPA